MIRSLAFLAALFTAQATADVVLQEFVPESGFYWNPDQPGRGYAIEVQDRLLFLAAYVYEDGVAPERRQPVWFTASGEILAERAAGRLSYRFEGELQYSTGGQCLGCDYREPVTVPSGRLLEIHFDGPTRARMSIDDEVIELFRFWYSSSITSPVFALFGQWMIVTDFSAVDASIQPFDGDLLEIGFTGSSQGQTTAEGFRGATDVAVAGAFNQQDDFYVIVVAERSDEYLAYYFDGFRFGTDRFVGLAERYRPGDELTGRGFPMQGFRVSDRTFAEQALGAKRPAGRGAGLEDRRPQRRPPGAKAARAAPADLAGLNRLVRRLEARLEAP